MGRAPTSVSWMRDAGARVEEAVPRVALDGGGQQGVGDAEALLEAGGPAQAELLAQAAELGYAPSAYRLGECYEYGKMGCPQDPALSIHYYVS